MTMFMGIFMVHAGEWVPLPKGWGKGPRPALHVAVMSYFFKRERFEANIAKSMYILNFGNEYVSNSYFFTFW